MYHCIQTSLSICSFILPVPRLRIGTQCRLGQLDHLLLAFIIDLTQALGEIASGR